MKLYNVSKRVYKYYQNNVKGNDNITFEEAQRKLSRNIELAIQVPVDDCNANIYLYGNLHIHTKGNKITKLKNFKIKNDWFYNNHKKKTELNQKYGIESKHPQWIEVGNLDYISEYAKGYSN